MGRLTPEDVRIVSSIAYVPFLIQVYWLLHNSSDSCSE